MCVCVCVCVSGPCPPCPKMVSVSCLCGKSSRVPRRCSAKSWSCAQICRRTLPCRIHTCANSCHAGITHLTLTDECIQTEELRWAESLSLSLSLSLSWSGDCAPCPRVSLQTCACGQQRAERPCASPEWHCDQVCVCICAGVCECV